MKVLHIMLSCFYIDKANYQENIIPRINKKDGHEVLIIASTDTFVKNNTLGFTDPGEYINEDGIKVVRIPYKKNVSSFLAMKIRTYSNDLYGMIEDFAPDIILFHGTAAYDLNVVGTYIKKNPKVILFVDSHEDFNNTATNFLSKQILHRLFYKPILKRNLKYIQKVLYITYESYLFMKDFYKVPENVLEFFPLGGILPDEEIAKNTRKEIRDSLSISEEDIFCVHSGKIDNLKRTEEILSAFHAVKNQRLHLVIIGSVDKKFEATLQNYLNKDKRIHFLGWKKPAELQNYLISADLYIQLGSQSATMQQAVCNGCVVAVFPFLSHKFLLKDNCYYISDEKDLVQVLISILEDKKRFNNLKKQSSILAAEVLDYNKISNMIFAK